MRFTGTIESINFLAGCTRPRPLSPRLGGSSSFVPIAVGAGFDGAGITAAVVAAGVFQLFSQALYTSSRSIAIASIFSTTASDGLVMASA
jgi:hypothetical protein